MMFSAEIIIILAFVDKVLIKATKTLAGRHI
jgi:hypothetical protein